MSELNEPQGLSIAAEGIAASIENYRQQFASMEQQLQKLEQHYQDQKALAIATLNQLKGAITALETLLVPPVDAPPSEDTKKE